MNRKNRVLLFIGLLILSLAIPNLLCLGPVGSVMVGLLLGGVYGLFTIERG